MNPGQHRAWFKLASIEGGDEAGHNRAAATALFAGRTG
jgi:hypothetical protein